MSSEETVFTPAEITELDAVLPIINGAGPIDDRVAALDRLCAVIGGTFTPSDK